MKTHLKANTRTTLQNFTHKEEFSAFEWHRIKTKVGGNTQTVSRAETCKSKMHESDANNQIATDYAHIQNWK